MADVAAEVVANEEDAQAATGACGSGSPRSIGGLGLRTRFDSARLLGAEFGDCLRGNECESGGDLSAAVAVLAFAVVVICARTGLVRIARAGSLFFCSADSLDSRTGTTSGESGRLHLQLRN